MKKLLLILISLSSLAAPTGFAQSAVQEEVALAFGGIDFVQNVSVYPNPSSNGTFNVSFTAADNGSDIVIRVYNLIGREVFSDDVRAGQDFRGSISIGELPRGVYMLEITNGQQKVTRRLSYI